MNNQQNEKLSWAENIIIVDADYADAVAFDLIVNFERMLERPIPPADMPLWLDCLALDGGLREGDNKIEVVLIHEKTTAKLNNFNPGNIAEQLKNKAFKDHIAEFNISTVSTETMVSKEQLFADVMQTIANLAEVKRIIAVPDMAYFDQTGRLLRNIDNDKQITMLAMQPMKGGNFKQEILGYSLMQALGIHADEINSKPD